MAKYDNDLPESIVDTSRVPGNVSGTLPGGINKQAKNARAQAQNAQNAAQNAANANPAGTIQNTRNARTQAIAKGQAQSAQNAAQLGARNADKAKAANIQRQVNAKAAQNAQNAQNAQAASIAKGQAQNAQSQSGKLGLTRQTTGNKVLDKLQQNKREKQPQKVQSQNITKTSASGRYDVTYDEKGRIVSITPKNTQSQPMYDRNGNRIIQGNGRFERAQRLAAGQDQSFQGPTGYNVGAVVNQVSQNNQARTLQNAQNIQGTQNTQGSQVQAPSGFNLLSYRTNNRRFNNGMNYLNNTFAGKKVTLDDGTQVDASKYFQDRMAKVLAHSNNPKALMHYMRSIQEDMARRGVGNFDISGELLKGTGMTDRGMANVLFQNKAAILQQLQPTSGGNQKPVVNKKSVTSKKPATTKYGAPLIKGNTMEQNTKMQNRFDPASLSLKFADNRTTPLTFDGLVREYRQAHKQNNIARMRILNNQMKKLYPDQYQNAQKLMSNGGSM